MVAGVIRGLGHHLREGHMRVLLSGIQRHKRVLTSLGSVVALLAALLVPVSAASAAVTTARSTGPATASAASTATPNTDNATVNASPKDAKPVDTAKPVPKPRTR